MVEKRYMQDYAEYVIECREFTYFTIEVATALYNHVKLAALGINS